jgi:Helix-turn-helix
MCSGLPEILSRYDGLVEWELRDRSAMSVDLAPLRDLLNHLNNPQKQFRTIHIAGTKGKGSVGALIEAGLDRAGLVCGRFSSPHVERITERITFGGKEISEAMLATMMKHAWLARESAMLRATAGRNATRFDLETGAEELKELMKECEPYGRQKEVAKELGVSEQILSNWLSGSRVPLLKNLFKIEEFLKKQKSKPKGRKPTGR